LLIKDKNCSLHVSVSLFDNGLGLLKCFGFNKKSWYDGDGESKVLKYFGSWYSVKVASL
jgi:hypothetical protein